MTQQRISIADVISLMQARFPERYQEDFDNTGLQVGNIDRPCIGVLLCVDVTPSILAEAEEKRCNLVVTHHPLIFHALKRLTGSSRVERAVWDAVKRDIAVYSCHTSADNTPISGVSWHMANMLGLVDVEALEEKGNDRIGSGAIGNLASPINATELIALVKKTFDTPVARCSDLLPDSKRITRIGLCGGAGSFLIPEAIRRGAQAFVTSDCKFNLFIDYAGEIQLIDIGHYESERCTTEMFAEAICQTFPSLPVYISQTEINPINYV